MTDDRACDAELVRAARGGDKAAFAALLVRHRPLLLALCRKALGEAALAEDAAQEAALQAMLGLDRLRRPEQFGPWLAGIGLNVCRRWRRERSREAWSWEVVQGGRSGPEPIATEAGPEEAAEAAELGEWVRRAVAGLPAGQRAAVLLVYLAGLTQAEAAAHLGVEVGAVKSRLHKARATLRRRLRATWEEETMATANGNGKGNGDEAMEMRVVDVRRRVADGEGTLTAVVLEEVGGGRRLPIWIGDFEGTAIALHLEGATTPRPLTYAFAADVLRAAGGGLREVRIERLVDDTFYAVAVVEGANGVHRVDARPSDALNLALLAGAPIRVDASVLAGLEAGESTGGENALSGEGVEGRAEIAGAMVARWSRTAPRSDPEKR